MSRYLLCGLAALGALVLVSFSTPAGAAKLDGASNMVEQTNLSARRYHRRYVRRYYRPYYRPYYYGGYAAPYYGYGYNPYYRPYYYRPYYYRPAPFFPFAAWW